MVHTYYKRTFLNQSYHYPDVLSFSNKKAGFEEIISIQPEPLITAKKKKNMYTCCHGVNLFYKVKAAKKMGDYQVKNPPIV